MPESEVFQPGHTYLKSGPHGTFVRFQVQFTGTPPVAFEDPQNTGPVAFGWAQRIDLDGIAPLGAWLENDFSGWMLDPHAEVVPQLAYRAKFDSMTLGTYTSRADAQEHCVTDLRNSVDLAGRTLGWVPESGDETAVSELSVFGPGLDDEDATAYSITPFELLTAYDPDAEE